MAKNFCNLCGKEFGFLNSEQITFYNIDGTKINTPPVLNEPVCISCARNIQPLSNGMRKQFRARCESVLETRECIKNTREIVNNLENKQIASFIEIAVQLEAWESLDKECERISDKINEHCRLEKKDCFAYDLKTRYDFNHSEYKQFYHCINSDAYEIKWLLVANNRLLVANKNAIPDLKCYDVNYEELILNNIKSIFDLQGLKKLYDYVPDFSQCWDYEVDIVPFENILFFNKVEQSDNPKLNSDTDTFSDEPIEIQDIMVSGPIGSILTSIAKSQPIAQNYVNRDAENEITILVYNYDNKSKLISLPGSAYYFLTKYLPEKETK